MKIVIQIIFIVVMIFTLIGTIAEGGKNKSLSQQLAAICTAATIVIGVSLFV